MTKAKTSAPEKAKDRFEIITFESNGKTSLACIEQRRHVTFQKEPLGIYNFRSQQRHHARMTLWKRRAVDHHIQRRQQIRREH
jgi:hypothetical protein